MTKPLPSVGTTRDPGLHVGWPQPPEVRTREPLAAIVQDVGVVAQVFPPPAAWLSTQDRWQDFLELSTPGVDALAAALASGEGDLAALRAAALAEVGAGPVAEADLRALLVDRVCHALSQLWAPVASKAFKACAAAFDSAVTVGDTDQLDFYADALTAAARLCGADPNVATWAVQRLQLAMCVDVRRGHPRKIATAFSTQPNRWAAVVELGAKLRAAASPLDEYPTLPPLRVCMDQHRQIQRHDPLDGPLPPGWSRTIDGWENEP